MLKHQLLVIRRSRRRAPHLRPTDRLLLGLFSRFLDPRRLMRTAVILNFLGHAKDSLLSLDLFRTESILLRTYWVLVVMDQFTRRIIGFSVHGVAVDGVALCHRVGAGF
jgi:hypothetical protein